MIAAIGRPGALAPWIFDGAMNGELFRAWIQEGLAPHLRAGDRVSRDNLATPQVAGIRKALEQAGAKLLYRPPYFPDPNPSENMWSKPCGAWLREPSRP